jgi:hypothetical protein
VTRTLTVIPAKAGIQLFGVAQKELDPGLRRDDENCERVA